MLVFTLWLLFFGSIAGLIYWHFARRAAEIKRNIDDFVREAHRLTEAHDIIKLRQLHADLKQYGDEFCVGRPWFGLYGYYVEAEWLVSGDIISLGTTSAGKKTQCAL